MKDLSRWTTLLRGQLKGGVYEWPNLNPILAFSSVKTTFSNWHFRLGHPSNFIFKYIMSANNLSFSFSPLSDHCNACLSNKSHKLSFAKSTITLTRPLQVIYSDVWTSPVYSIVGYKYYVIFVDYFTKYTWCYPLKQKYDVKDIFKRFKIIVEKHFDNSIKTFYFDNRGEFIALRDFLSINDIAHLTTPPHTPEHNGLSERKHLHIVETGLALLSNASIPLQHWSYAFTTVVYLINKMPTPTLQNHSPYEKLFNSSPNYLKLKIFGCLCYPWLKLYTSHKLESNFKPCIFLGYSTSQSAYICLDPQTSHISVSRHVRFIESIYPFKHLHVIESRPNLNTIDTWIPLHIYISSPSTLVPLDTSPTVEDSQ